MSDSGTPSVVELQRMIAVLRQELTDIQQVLYRKNRMLDAIHYVWCDGGCAHGVHRYDEQVITEALVRDAERYTARLRRWWVHNQAKQQAREARDDPSR
jgi:hypothetical protein